MKEAYFEMNYQAEQVLEPLFQWGILTTREIHEDSIYNKTTRTIRKRLSSYVERGYVKEVILPYKNKKAYYLTNRCFREYGSGVNPVNEDHLIHDLIVGRALRGINEVEGFESASWLVQDLELNGTVFNRGYDLDGIYSYIKSSKFYNIGLEVERTRKANNRILDKYEALGTKGSLHQILYIFTSERIKRIYIDQLKNLKRSKKINERESLKFNFINLKNPYADIINWENLEVQRVNGQVFRLKELENVL